jgi:exosome complex RNA-binding protein Csl4
MRPRREPLDLDRLKRAKTRAFPAGTACDECRQTIARKVAAAYSTDRRGVIAAFCLECHAALVRELEGRPGA